MNRLVPIAFVCSAVLLLPSCGLVNSVLTPAQRLLQSGVRTISKAELPNQSPDLSSQAESSVAVRYHRIISLGD